MVRQAENDCHVVFFYCYSFLFSDGKSTTAGPVCVACVSQTIKCTYLYHNVKSAPPTKLFNSIFCLLFMAIVPHGVTAEPVVKG